MPGRYAPPGRSKGPAAGGTHGPPVPPRKRIPTTRPGRLAASPPGLPPLHPHHGNDVQQLSGKTATGPDGSRPA
jgi:hypothetical protein